MANDELMRLAERVEALALSCDVYVPGATTIAADLRDLAQRAPQNGAVPEGWRQFVQECAGTAGGEVCGNNLSSRAKALLAAAPAPEAVMINGLTEAETAATASVMGLKPEAERAKGDVYEAYKTWPDDIRAKLSVHDLRRMSGWAPRTHVGDWRIDTSAGRPILVYQNCSVIEAETATYVLGLIARDAPPPAGQPENDALNRILQLGEELNRRDARIAMATWDREYAELMARKPKGVGGQPEGVEALASSWNREAAKAEEETVCIPVHEVSWAAVNATVRTFRRCADELRRLASAQRAAGSAQQGDKL